MTKNRRAKQATRKIALTENISYTEALRKLKTESSLKANSGESRSRLIVIGYTSRNNYHKVKEAQPIAKLLENNNILEVEANTAVDRLKEVTFETATQSQKNNPSAILATCFFQFDQDSEAQLVFNKLDNSLKKLEDTAKQLNLPIILVTGDSSSEKLLSKSEMNQRSKAVTTWCTELVNRADLLLLPEEVADNDSRSVYGIGSHYIANSSKVENQKSSLLERLHESDCNIDTRLETERLGFLFGLSISSCQCATAKTLSTLLSLD